MRARSLLIALAALAAATGAQAHGLSVPMNHSVRLPLSGPAQSVVVGSPSVIDVAVVDSRTVYVSGKTPGDTDVTVIDPLGRVVYRGDVSVAGGASVNVFRGSTRTQAACAPACRELSADQATAAAASVSPATPASTGGMAPMSMASQAASSVPSALAIPH